jgi:outer membrane protein assembly factor BamB
MVCVGSGDNNLYTLDSDGTLAWSFKTGYDVSSSPAIGSDGMVYLTGLLYDTKLYAINSDGTLAWTVGLASSSSPAVGNDGTIYVSGSPVYGGFKAFNSDGTLKWSY